MPFLGGVDLDVGIILNVKFVREGFETSKQPNIIQTYFKVKSTTV